MNGDMEAHGKFSDSLDRGLRFEMDVCIYLITVDIPAGDYGKFGWRAAKNQLAKIVNLKEMGKNTDLRRAAPTRKESKANTR